MPVTKGVIEAVERAFLQLLTRTYESVRISAMTLGVLIFRRAETLCLADLVPVALVEPEVNVTVRDPDFPGAMLAVTEELTCSPTAAEVGLVKPAMRLALMNKSATSWA